MGELVGQLVFLAVVLLVTWLSKRASEAEKRRRAEREQVSEQREPAVSPPPRPRRPQAAPAVARLSVARPLTAGARKVGALSTAAGVVGQGALTRGRRRRMVWRQLAGAAAGRPTPGTVQRGVLWSEVLGPPRALRGPHRPPSAARRPLPGGPPVSTTREP